MGKFYIGEKEIKEFVLSKIVSEDLNNLPDLEVKKAISLTKGNTHFILQREYVYQNNAENSDTNFLITRDLGNCIVAYFYTGAGDSLLIHCDSNCHFEWHKIFADFKSTNIKFTLVGGIKENGKENTLSRFIIKEIIETLFNITKKSELKITLVSQLLFYDQLTEEDKYDYIASLLFKAFNFFSWFKFGKELNTTEINPSALKSATIENIGISNMIFPKLEKIFDILFNPLEFVKNLNFINDLIKDEESLTLIVKAMFTKEGYQAVCKSVNSSGLTPNYRSLGFDCHTHKLVIVNELFWQLILNHT